MPKSHTPERPFLGPVPQGRRALWLFALMLLELAALTILYQFFARIECLATEAETFCRGLRSLVSRALSVTALLALLCWARPSLARRFLDFGSTEAGGARWRALHFVGVALLLVPLLLAGGSDMAPDFLRYAPFWAMGALAALVGGLFWLIRPAAWTAVASNDAWGLALILLGGVLLPDLADLAQPLWAHWPALTAATFHSVAGILHVTGLPVYVDAPGFILGLQRFAVRVAQQCSGVEGMALVTGFTFFYAMLFRSRLHLWRYWLVVLPLGIAASWFLNVLRIAALILIGEYVSADLAVNGFHSFAGTLFFTLLALGLMWVVQVTPWFHRAGFVTAHKQGLRQDWLAARIIPFIVFMLLSSIAAALFAEPEVGYPLKAIGMGLALGFFLPALRGQKWAPALPPVLAGVVVGIFWLALAVPDTARRDELLTILGAFSSFGLGFWVVSRLIGTVVLVPVIEELFFRGYLLARMDRPELPLRMLALLLSSLAFGALHGRWWAGALSGLVFGLVYLWRSRVSDAVWAHIAANFVVALGAMYWRDWTLI